MLHIGTKKYYIGTTRFNTNTFEENKRWKINNNFQGCIYGLGTGIQKNTPIDSNVFVIEMNNSINKIEGIGLIKNHYYSDKKYNIYQDKNYNRFIFKGHFYKTREQLKKINEKFVETIESELFYGYTHLKRGQGITLVSQDKIYENKNILLDMFEILIFKSIINKNIITTIHRENNENKI